MVREFKVSVIIPVYNAENYLIKAVNSARILKPVKEIILLEDGSKDNSLNICKDLSHEYEKVQYYQHPDKKNHGAGASRNLGLTKAKCPFISFLDADDFYLENRFEKDEWIFSNNEKVDGTYNAIGAHYYNEEAKKNFQTIFKSEITTVKQSGLNSRQLFESMIQYSKQVGYFSLDGFTVKKEALEKLDHWFNPKLRLHQDTEFITRTAYLLNLVHSEIEKPVAVRGVHGKNRITNNFLDEKKRLENSVKLSHALYYWSLTRNIEITYKKHLLDEYISKYNVLFDFIMRNEGLKEKVVYYAHVLNNLNIFRDRTLLKQHTKTFVKSFYK